MDLQENGGHSSVVIGCRGKGKLASDSVEAVDQMRKEPDMFRLQASLQSARAHGVATLRGSA